MPLVTLSSDVYTAICWYRLTKGKPQPESAIWRSAVESTFTSACQRLADRVAADDGLYVALMQPSQVTLGTSGTAGEEFVNNFTPTLLLSEKAKDRWRVLMSINGVPNRFTLHRKNRRHDLDNPAPIPDPTYFNYAVSYQKIIVRDQFGNIPSGTLLITIYGNVVPTAGSQFPDELLDNLADCGIEILSENGDINALLAAAAKPTAAPKEPPQPGIPMGAIPPQQ